MTILFLINISYVRSVLYLLFFLLLALYFKSYKYIACLKISDFTFLPDMKSLLISVPMHGLRTPGEEMVFTARSKINPHSQIFRYSRSIFCMPHRTKISDFFYSCLHWVSVVRVWHHRDSWGRLTFSRLLKSLRSGMIGMPDIMSPRVNFRLTFFCWLLRPIFVLTPHGRKILISGSSEIIANI